MGVPPSVRPRYVGHVEVRMRAWIVLAAGLVACGGKDGDSAGAGDGVVADPYMNILSPTPGQYVDEGEEVLLSAEGRTGLGELTELSDLVWESDDGVFRVEGNDVLVTDLHPGVYALLTEGVVAGQAVSGSVDVVVYAQR